ncbi:MAG: PPC domain-containing DNA-binding protein [Desulfobacter sp.]
MKYSQGQYGRVFIVRLEDGDVIHEQIEALAQKESIQSGMLFILGGADKNSRVIVGPCDGDDIKPGMPVMSRVFDHARESVGVGTLFPTDAGQPMLHLHLACGRGDSTITGCTRSGVVTWRYMEAVLIEITQCSAQRVTDPETGFYMLKP